MKKPTILFVHGAWHTVEYLQPTTYLLRGKGYSSVCVQLPSVGANPPLKSTDEDVETVRKALADILDHKKQNVVLVMHSYGGIVGSSAAEGFSKEARQAAGKDTWITSMCYVCSFAGSKGDSLNSLLRPTFGDAYPPFYRIKGGMQGRGGTAVYFHGAEKHLYQDLDEEDQKKYTAKLKHHSLPTFDSPITYDAVHEIPSSYLVCTNDQALPADVQEQLIAKAQRPPYHATFMHVERIAAGHTPFVGKHSQSVCDFIRRAAGEKVPM